MVFYRRFLAIVSRKRFSETKKNQKTQYRRIPIITAPVIFGFSSPKGPLLSGGRYFRVAVTFGWLENVCNSAVVLHKEDT